MFSFAFTFIAYTVLQFAGADLAESEKHVNQKLVNLLASCSEVDLAGLSTEYNYVNINSVGNKLVFMQGPNNPFMDNSGPKVKKVIKLNKNGSCTLRDPNLFDSDLGKNRLSYADHWLFQCQGELINLRSNNFEIGNISEKADSKKGTSNFVTLKYGIYNKSGDKVGHLHSYYQLDDQDMMLEDYIPEPVGKGCLINLK